MRNSNRSIAITYTGPRKHSSRTHAEPDGTVEKEQEKGLPSQVLGPKLLLAMGCVKLGEKNCVHLPSVGEQTAN